MAYSHKSLGFFFDRDIVSGCLCFWSDLWMQKRPLENWKLTLEKDTVNFLQTLSFTPHFLKYTKNKKINENRKKIFLIVNLLYVKAIHMYNYQGNGCTYLWLHDITVMWRAGKKRTGVKVKQCKRKLKQYHVHIAVYVATYLQQSFSVSSNVSGQTHKQVGL